ncbi:MAG: barstar family protein [Nocardioides sp.]|uniref:barstar family protein n=1 Tax=Nocardioides sp. TaxID=35761 RepID=UPI0039E55B00
MSGLAALLAGRKDAGIYTWHGAFGAADVKHTVEHAGWHFAYVDGWHGDTKREFMEDIGEALHFPDHFGKNFDALADCLRGVSCGEGHGTLLLWDGWGPFARHEEDSFDKIVKVLGERVAIADGGAFAVLMRGEGPEISGLQSLD